MLPEFLPNIGALPRPLQFVRDIEEFEGAILSELKAQQGSVYLEKWCARDEGIVRTLIVRTEQRALAQYLAGRLTMLDLLTIPSDGVGFLVDRAGDEVRAVYVVSISELPEKYLPSDQALHDPSLRPNWAKTPQNFLLDAEWDGKLLAKIERLYADASAFNSLTAHGSTTHFPVDLYSYNYDGGFPIMHAFNRIRSAIPVEARTKTVGVSINSPGVFTIDAPTDTATRLLVAMGSLVRTQAAYDNVHAWSRFKPQKADLVPATALDQLRRFCDAIGVDHAKLLPSPAPDKGTILVAGKLVASYYRKLWKLVEPGSGVEFIGPEAEERASEPNFLDEDDEEEEWP